MPEIIDEYGGILFAVISVITVAGFFCYEFMTEGSMLFKLFSYIAALYL